MKTFQFSIHEQYRKYKRSKLHQELQLNPSSFNVNIATTFQN